MKKESKEVNVHRKGCIISDSVIVHTELEIPSDTEYNTPIFGNHPHNGAGYAIAKHGEASETGPLGTCKKVEDESVLTKASDGNH